MRSLFIKFIFLVTALLMSNNSSAQGFQGQAFYFSKSKMELGNWGARLSKVQKNQIRARLKNRLEKTYVLSFNKEESVFIEEDKIDAISGATDSWGGTFARGKQYKNVKENALIQAQEFYGKRFLVKDKLQEIKWEMGTETKQIGQYTCYKAMALIPTAELTWFDFSWNDIRQSSNKSEEPNLNMTQVEAWYTLQIPVGHGPAEYWGLPGLILEVSAGNTTMLCSKIIINPKNKIKLDIPSKGKEITKSEYQKTIRRKMTEMRDNRGRRRS